MEAQSNATANTATNVESVQPSFDEVVELISTGRADQIPGIKDIPLKVSNEPKTLLGGCATLSS